MPHSSSPDRGREPELEIDPTEESPLLAGAPVKPVPEDAGAPVAQELSVSKLLVVMGSIYIGTFFAALDGTVVSTLLAPISDSFDSFALVGWMTTAFLIATAAVQPLAGKMSDIYGRRPALILANTLFLAGTAMCALAKNEYVFIVGRVLAGAGGGGMNAMSTIVASDLVPLRKRGIWQGCGNIAWGAGGALGGFYGGVIADTIGWRWAFTIQLPFILLSALLVVTFVRVPAQPSDVSAHRRVDYLGSATLVSFLVLFLLALNTGGSLVPWNHPLVYVSLPVSMLVLAAFFYVEARVAKEPIIPLSVLGERTVLSAGLTFFFSCIAFYVLYFFYPLYFMLRGQSVSSAGLRMAPFALGVSGGSVSAGLAMNSTGRYYAFGLIAMTFFNIGIGLIATFTLETPVVPQFLYFGLFGLGYGAILTVGLTALIAAVAHAQQAVSTSTSYLFRSTGATMGTAVGTAVFQTVLRKRLVVYLGDGEEAREVVRRVLRSFEEVGRLEGWARDGVVKGYMDALHAVFWTSLGFGLVAMACCACMREHKLHRTLDRKVEEEDDAEQ